MFCALDTFRGPKFVPVGRLRLLGRFWKTAWRDEKWMLNMTCKSNGKRCKQRSSKIISILRHLHQSRSIINRESGLWTKTHMKSHAKSIPALQHRFELKRWPHMPQMPVTVSTKSTDIRKDFRCHLLSCAASPHSATAALQQNSCFFSWRVCRLPLLDQKANPTQLLQCILALSFLPVKPLVQHSFDQLRRGPILEPQNVWSLRWG